MTLSKYISSYVERSVKILKSISDNYWKYITELLKACPKKLNNHSNHNDNNHNDKWKIVPMWMKSLHMKNIHRENSLGNPYIYSK